MLENWIKGARYEHEIKNILEYEMDNNDIENQ